MLVNVSTPVRGFFVCLAKNAKVFICVRLMCSLCKLPERLLRILVEGAAFCEQLLQLTNWSYVWVRRPGSDYSDARFEISFVEPSNTAIVQFFGRHRLEVR